MQPDDMIARHAGLDDFHVTRIMGCRVGVSHGEPVEIDRSDALDHCPLQSLLSDADVEDYVREKVADFGHFTGARELVREAHGVPFGASEMLMHALRRGVVDCAVTVCDGAGTVVSADGAVVQGVGARMNGLFHTTPVPDVLMRLRERGAVCFDDAKIDQRRGFLAAADAGFRRVAVTVSASLNESFSGIREAAAETDAEVVLLAVCATGVDDARAGEVMAESDLVWACASEAIRRSAGTARIQVTQGIPVFAMTDAGLEILAAYADADGAARLSGLPPDGQYLLASFGGGERLVLGGRPLRLREASLPVRSRNEPRPMR